MILMPGEWGQTKKKLHQQQHANSYQFNVDKLEAAFPQKPLMSLSSEGTKSKSQRQTCKKS